MIDELLRAAQQARRDAPPVGDERYAAFTDAAAAAVRTGWDDVVAANEADLAECREQGLPEPLLRRMRLTDADLDALETGCRGIRAELPDGGTGDVRTTPDGRTVRRLRRPLGVILMIFEARAGITVRNAVMAAATGNASLLRGGKEIGRTNAALGEVLRSALADCGLPPDLVSIVDSSSRSELRELLGRDDAIDVVVPRGSPGLIAMCRRNSSIPLIVSGAGVNHLYVDRSADLPTAAQVTVEGKLHDPAACTAVEMVLVHEAVLDGYLAALAERVDPGADLRLRVAPEVADRVPAGLRAALDPDPLQDLDDGREYLDPTLALRVVPDADAAIGHVTAHGTAHTEGLVAEDPAVVERFTREVDAAAIVVNGPMRLHDGPALGLGPAIALSTGRLHARGPVTVHDLTTHTWVVEGHAVPA